MSAQITQTAAEHATTNDDLHFGWFIPTMGDTSAFGDPSARIEPSMDMFVRIAQAAERAGMEYALVPVMTECYEAWITCAMIAARTQSLTLLVAARPGLIAPTVTAKMINTFDQLSGGRIAINLIAGGSPAEAAADGVFHEHDERYEIIDETVSLMKRVWTEDEPVDHKGKFFTVEGAVVKPKPYQKPFPQFFLGGLSDSAMDVCAKHADVYLFWGDTPENVAANIVKAKERAAHYGREEQLGFGMRLQTIVRDTEDEAWAAAEALIAGSVEGQKWTVAGAVDSRAQERMLELVQAENYRIAPHLWSGISSVRPGAGVAVVGNPEQVADTLLEFVEAGCTHFCLSGYPHDDAAERFGRDVMPIIRRKRAALEES
ncbi:LLM class flavin-dependent oxidoreductase [Streptomyces sp. NBC_01718]|uniref:LLM class flavin-dependent oxidoreductase n=1 Tax=Streptomyces sp. NBC_01718 TaxID=2975919 RepID=UPI00352CE5B2